MGDNPILAKSFAFALRIVKLCRYLAEKHKEYSMTRELLSAGTNIGKYAMAATGAESREGFVLSMAKALQRADETEYWLRLIHYAGFVNEKEFESIEADRKELAKMLTKIVKTSREDG